MARKRRLTLPILLKEAAVFAEQESRFDEPKLYGVTDGKAVGTYLEVKFVNYLAKKYEYQRGNSASGIDFPSLNVDVKVTSVRQPQSSCPFKSARQKIFGLGYHLLVFIYAKSDDQTAKTARLDIQHTIFVDKTRTADFQTTSGLRRIVENDGNEEDIAAFLHDRNLPVDEGTMEEIAREVLKSPPPEGLLTISNALQWRLQYGRAVSKAGKESGVVRIR